jgi:hypothetical protein
MACPSTLSHRLSRPFHPRSPMKRLVIGFISLVACSSTEGPAEHYGFIARLGNDTVSVENVSRTPSSLTSDEVDRFPRVSQRHTEISLAPDGSIKHFVMDIHTPSEPAGKQDRHVEVDVTSDAVHPSPSATRREHSNTISRQTAALSKVINRRCTVSTSCISRLH